MNKIQLTQEGLAKLQEELKELQEVKRPAAVERLAKARSMGDLKENSEYSAAKEELAFVEGRVQEIQTLLKNAAVVESTSNGGEIGLGKKVTIQTNGDTSEFKIVGEYEADLAAGKLSNMSPIGQALVGKKAGDEVEIEIPAGKVIYKILKVN